MIISSIAILFFFLCYPASAFAIQAHGEPEGLYAHQMAHVFFAVTMGLLIYWLRRRGLVASRGWRYIQYAAFFFILWNIVAFTGHWMEEQSGLIENRRIGLMRIGITTARGYEWMLPVYYAAKLDHLFSVPAMIFMFMGLRRLLHAPQVDDREGS